MTIWRRGGAGRCWEAREVGYPQGMHPSASYTRHVDDASTRARQWQQTELAPPTPFTPTPSWYVRHGAHHHAWLRATARRVVCGCGSAIKQGMGQGRKTGQRAPSTRHPPLRALARRVNRVLMVPTYVPTSTVLPSSKAMFFLFRGRDDRDSIVFCLSY